MLLIVDHVCILRFGIFKLASNHTVLFDRFICAAMPLSIQFYLCLIIPLMLGANQIANAFGKQFCHENVSNMIWCSWPFRAHAQSSSTTTINDNMISCD